jgi:hypothetical protein
MSRPGFLLKATAIVLVVCALPAGKGTAAAQAQFASPAKCKPSPTRWCVRQASLSHDAVALVSAGDAPSVRAAFDFVPLKDLFSSSGKTGQV